MVKEGGDFTGSDVRESKADQTIELGFGVHTLKGSQMGERDVFSEEASEFDVVSTDFAFSGTLSVLKGDFFRGGDECGRKVGLVSLSVARASAVVAREPEVGRTGIENDGEFLRRSTDLDFAC